jgi:hypothetical protein
MKTLQHSTTKEIRRLSDKDADKLVAADNNWKFIPKEVWKKARGWDRKTKED